MKKNKFCFFIVLVFLITNEGTFSQGKIQASHEYSEGKITIYYEFQGDQNKIYEVMIKLKRTSDSDFEIIPADLSGDVGEGKFAGKKNRIVWAINEEEAAQLEGEDFYFDVIAEVIVEGGGIPWYVFAGGAALAGGTAAILLLGGTDSGETTTTQPTSGFPTPPVRP
jgi:hypothetical protein